MNNNIILGAFIPIAQAMMMIKKNLFFQFREEIRQTVERIVTGVVGKDLTDTVLSKRVPPSDYDCYEAAVTKFSQECYKLGKARIQVHV